MYKITVTNHDGSVTVSEFDDKKYAETFVSFLRTANHSNMSYTTNF
jgi:hypothetical protein